MSALPSRTSPATGVISELALARAQRNTVLIIDDLFSSRLLIAEIVRQIDPKLNLELFDTPSRALEYARQNRVDMVLTDFKLPGMNGVEVLERLKEERPELPVVLFSVYYDDPRAVSPRARALADGLVGKPIDHEAMERLVRDLLADTDDVSPRAG